MENRKYKVYPFILNDLIDDFVVVQNAKGIVALKQQKMKKMFLEMDEKRYEEIDDKFIYSFMREQNNKAIEFMIKNHLICIEQTKQIEFKKIKFFTNCDKIKQSLEQNLKDFELVDDVVSILKYENFDCNKNSVKGNLNIFILNPFDYREFVKLSELLNECNVLYQIIFYYNKGFYFSNYFKKEWNAPCPICFFERIESELRAESQAGINSFQMIIDLIYYKKTTFKTEIVLSSYMIIPILNLIIKQISNIDEQLIKLVNYIDLNTQIVSTDIATCWELCECNE